ncbi:hypothetical protein SAMN05421805_106181 [Saccharopolyspora antimicrobica]|uniref:WD40-like Beta Propeller Repeat n=1 Tax=Saccharopolyspora antimicrobica TaxID=455193 RepID=A0A1I5BAC0_9PSEU|nr:hypothetical protein ATL45_4906 [Saccharopolyspora antimicrobica]SFN71662.1 hypothetical protein SAMN05421805_106181 [Saccharopolyspora antimicrobica]
MVAGAAVSLAAFAGAFLLLLPAGTPRGTWSLGRDGSYYAKFTTLGWSGDIVLAHVWPSGPRRGVNLRTGYRFEYSRFWDVMGAGGSQLVTMPSGRGVLEVRDTSSGDIVSTIPVGGRGEYNDYSVQFVENGTIVAVLNSADQVVSFWEVRTARPVREVDVSALIPDSSGGVSSMWASPPGSGPVLGLNTTTGSGWQWNYETGVVQVHSGPCSESYCEVLAAGSADSVVLDPEQNVIRTSNGKELHVLDVVGLANSPSEWEVSEDGRTLFTFYRDGEIRAWPLPSP